MTNKANLYLRGFVIASTISLLIWTLIFSAVVVGVVFGGWRP